MMRSNRPSFVAVLVVLTTVMAAMVLLDRGVSAQPPALIYGQNSGTIKAIATDSVGRLNMVMVASGDPCLDPNVAKSSVAVTATGQQVALQTSSLVYVCGFYATFGGTSPTITFQYGTGSNCGTGTVALSGAIAPAPNGTELVLGHGGTVMKAIASNALCIALAGTSPTVAGVLSYVQQ